MAEAQSPSAHKRLEVTASSDTWVDEASPAAVRGEEPELITRFEDARGSRILLGFDLHALDKSVIQSAFLRLSLIQGSGEDPVTIGLSLLRDRFSETETTWSNQPERTRTFVAQVIGTTPAAVSFDVTSIVAEGLYDGGQGARFLGIALSGPVAGSPPTYSRTFSSREGQGVPKLAVEYTPSPEVRREVAGSEPASGRGRGQAVAVALAVLIAAGAGGVLMLRQRGR